MVWYVGRFDSAAAYSRQVATTVEPEAVAYAWHDPSVFDGEPWQKGCYARVDRYGAVAVKDFVRQPGVISGRVSPIGWQSQAQLDITQHVSTEHKEEDGELYAPAMDKRKLRLSVPVKSVLGKQGLDGLELKVLQSDFNMGMVPVAKALFDEYTFLTTTPTAYRMGSDPNLLSRGNHTTGNHAAGTLGDGAPAAPTHWIVNALAGLDSPGSWAVTQTGLRQTVYYWPAYLDNNNSVALGDVWLPTLTELVTVKGDNAQSPAGHVHFSELIFTGGDRYSWGGQDQGGLQHDYAAADAPDALFRLRFTTNVLVRNCSFVHSGGAGLRMDLMATQNAVESSEFSRLGLQGVVVVGSGAGKADLCHANIVQNCSIHHTGRDKYDAPAIVLWHCAFNNISGNHIHHVPSKAVLLGGIRSLVFDPSL